MRSVNLLPTDDASQSGRLPPPPVLAACLGAVVVTAVLAVMYLSGSSKIGQQQRALDTVQAQYQAMPAPAVPDPDVAALPLQRQTRVSALAMALGQRVAWDRLLREVSQVVPSDVWLMTLNATSPAINPPSPTPTDTAPSGFAVTGCTYSQESVARFLARLSLVPDLASMTLGKSMTDASGAGGAGAGACPARMFTFTLVGNVRASGGTS